MARAGWRALVFALLWHLPEHLSVLLLGTAGTQAPDQGALVGVGVAGGALAGIAVMWSTMRRHNGLRGLHEFASRTRVVTTPRRDTRPVLVAAGPVLRPPADAPTIGDYAIVDTANEPVVRGYDPKLQRPVWIHRPPPGTPAVPAPRRNASRAGRPRWLAGRREPGATWDVYEAFAGGPLRDVARRPVPWAAVRHWLADLAAEIGRPRRGTAPVPRSGSIMSGLRPTDGPGCLTGPRRAMRPPPLPPRHHRPRPRPRPTARRGNGFSPA